MNQCQGLCRPPWQEGLAQARDIVEGRALWAGPGQAFLAATCQPHATSLSPAGRPRGLCRGSRGQCWLARVRDVF